MKKKINVSYEDYLIKFKKLLKSLGLKSTLQREYILKILFESDEHLSAKDMLSKSKEDYKLNMNISTIYSIVNLFERMNIIDVISIKGKNTKVYELSFFLHHDHIICIKCSKIVDFVSEEIEQLQLNIAKRNNFILKNHCMMLYGLCSKCRGSE